MTGLYLDVLKAMSKAMSTVAVLKFLHIIKKEQKIKINEEKFLLSCVQENVKNVEKSLERIFGDKYEKFRSILVECQAVLSGYFLLQHLTNDATEDTDIDIYIPTTKRMMEMYDNLPYTIAHLYLKDNFECKGRDRTQAYSSPSWIDDVFNYNVNGYKIQIITTRTTRDELLDYIRSKVDFDVCKNTYDFETKFLFMESPQSICYKRATFNYTRSIGSSIKRCLKYKRRGFTFHVRDGVLDEIKKCIHYDFDSKENYEKLKKELKEGVVLKVNYCKHDITNLHIRKCHNFCPLLIFDNMPHLHVNYFYYENTKMGSNHMII